MQFWDARACSFGRATRLRLFSALCLAIPCAANHAVAQTAGDIVGRVTGSDGGAPLADVIVLLDGTSAPGRTGVDGRFKFASVRVGVHTVEFRRPGYALTTRTVDVAGELTASLDVVLDRVATAIKSVTVIGTRTDLEETRKRMDKIPGAVSIVEPAEIRATRQANLKDVLKFTPGVFVQPRFGAADESQISVRGSGLRNNFHARGMNLLVNGMPYRNADGFTDFESLELLTTEAIEVYKGGNALAYGGSTLGGAINLTTKTGYTASPVSLFAQGGSFGFYKAQIESGRELGPFDYYASYARTSLDGYRDWSDQQRDRVNLHGGYRLSDRTDMRAFYFFAHVQEHLPGALSAATFASAPGSADPVNKAGRWGRDYDLHHVGVQLRAQLTPTQRIEISPYMQYRDIDHPIFQVIAQISHDYGAELRYMNSAPLARFENSFTFGIQPAYESLINKQFVNNAGDHGALTKDQHDEVTSVAAYAEDVLSLTPAVSAVLGLRLDNSTRKTKDFFLSNGDQSDSRTFRPVTPKIGLLYNVPGIRGQVFANASRSFEPPLLLELNSLTIPGFVELEGQDAWQYEIGARGRSFRLSWEAALYDIELKNEILNLNVQPFPNAPFTVPTYRNSPKTRHAGLETGLAYQLPGGVFLRGDIQDHVALRAAYTYARYTFVEDPDYKGNDIPGAPQHSATVEIKYTHPSGFAIAPTVEWIPRSYFLNSANTVKNDAWSSFGFRAEWAVENAGVTAFVAGSNLADRRFSQSAQVDNVAGKYYEPSDRRAFYGGLRWTR
jgi:iron complex outermembrane receptor protein